MTLAADPSPATNPQSPDTPAPRWADALRAAAADIKLHHSVFALPFAVLAVFLARPEFDGPGRLVGKLALVVVCMVFARTWAMLVNRLADRRLDADNPRTARRAIPAGRLSAQQALALALAAAALFVLSTAGFWTFFDNPWPARLSIPVLAWIAFYSFTKRFTAWCHVFLGGALAASPLAAAIAVGGIEALSPPAAGTWSIWLLAGFVLLWVAGFDVLYALQDQDFDKAAGLRSVPAALGPGRAAWLSRAMHALAFALLVLAWAADPRLSLFFAIALAAVAALLITEHVVLSRRGLAGLPLAFFTINGIVSCLLGVAGILDLVLA